jgi:1,2-diacylglycerol 3-beta-galactosyltransferase
MLPDAPPHAVPTEPPDRALTRPPTGGLPPAASPLRLAPLRPASQPRTVLLLLADTGGGHRASAEAVAGELVRLPEAPTPYLLDPFAHASPRTVGWTVGLYSPLIRHLPPLWGALYHASNSRAAVSALRVTALRLLEPGLGELIDALSPAAVVSFHPLVNHAAARVLRRRPGTPIPLITVITDLVDVHSAWICEDADAVVTPSAAALNRIRLAGIDADRCFDLGLPVDESFTASPLGAAERRELRRRLGLDPVRRTVLLTGGGEGSGGLLRRARALCAAGLDIQLVVICGRNTAVRERLATLEPVAPTRLHVEGFVPNMAEWMRASDLLISKAGPATITEALCAGVPLLLTSHLPGQERGNVDLVVAVGAGRHVPGDAALVDAVAELVRPGSTALLTMRDALLGIARPHASAATARLIALLSARAATGAW